MGVLVVKAAGDALIDAGIASGDELICLTEFQSGALRNGQLVLVRLPLAGLCARFWFCFDGQEALLRAANPRYEDLIVRVGVVKVWAVVIRSIKNWG